MIKADKDGNIGKFLTTVKIYVIIKQKMSIKELGMEIKRCDRVIPPKESGRWAYVE
jgi:hypothetical protein